MEKSEYEKIKENIIEPLVDEILTSENNKLYNVVTLNKNFGDELFSKINQCILYVKKYFVITDELDRHKISACLLSAILMYSPFKIKKNGYNLENLIYANELLGIYAAISLLECYEPNLHIEFPSTIYKAKDIDPYVKTLCMALYMNKKNRQLKSNIMSYANILFLLEKLSKH